MEAKEWCTIPVLITGCRTRLLRDCWWYGEHIAEDGAVEYLRGLWQGRRAVGENWNVISDIFTWPRGNEM